MKMRLWLRMFLAGLFLVAASAPASAQQASFVTMIGTNANYPNGTMTANFLPPANSSQFDYLKYHFPFTVSTPLSSSGVWSMSLADTGSVLPLSSQWRMQLCSAGTLGAPTCFTFTSAVTCINNGSCSGTTLDLSSSFAAAPVPPQLPSTPAACLAAASVTTPCVAYQGSFTALGVAGTTGVQTLYTNNAPAGASYLFCPGVFTTTAGTGGTITEAASFTTPGGGTRSGATIGSAVLTGTGTVLAGCTTIAVAANSSLSFSVAAVSGTGTPVWETNPVVLRIH